MHTSPRTNRVFGFIIILAAATAVLSGCGAKNNLVGKWKPKTTTGQGANPFAALNMVKEYKADGTEVTTMSMGPTSMSMDGTYTVSGDTLNETIKDPMAGGVSMPIPGLSGAHTSKFKIDGDTLTLTSSNGPVNMNLEF